MTNKHFTDDELDFPDFRPLRERDKLSAKEVLQERLDSGDYVPPDLIKKHDLKVPKK